VIAGVDRLAPMRFLAPINAASLAAEQCLVM